MNTINKLFDFSNLCMVIGFSTGCYGMWILWGYVSVVIGGAVLFCFGVFLDILSIKMTKKGE